MTFTSRVFIKLPLIPSKSVGFNVWETEAKLTVVRDKIISTELDKKTISLHHTFNYKTRLFYGGYAEQVSRNKS